MSRVILITNGSVGRRATVIVAGGDGAEKIIYPTGKTKDKEQRQT